MRRLKTGASGEYVFTWSALIVENIVLGLH